MNLLLLLALYATDKADTAFEQARFKKAASLYMRELAALPDKGGASEQRIRARIALSYFNADDRVAAREAYTQLIQRFPDFRYDPKEVMPEAITFFEPAPPASAEVAPAPAPEIVVALTPPESQPPRSVSVIVVPEKRAWKPYYLAPFGIGQFLARSPVRGAIFLALEVGLLATNIATAVLFLGDQLPTGRFAHPEQSRSLQIVMNVSFFAAIASFAAGAIDGGFFEP